MTKPINKEPIYPKAINPAWGRQTLNTYEIECSSCHELRWPSLPTRPSTYVCARCTAVGASTVIQRHQKALRGAATRRAKKDQ